MRIVAPDAQLSILEIRWGLIPDMTGTAMLPLLVGLDRAKELTFTGRMVSGTEAVQIGLATRVSDTPLDDALALAREIAGKSPTAVRGAKKLLNASPYRGVAEQFADERSTIGSLIGRPNQVEAVMAFFEKRTLKFHGLKDRRQRQDGSDGGSSSFEGLGRVRRQRATARGTGAGRRSHCRIWRVRGDHGAVGLGQEHAAESSRRVGYANRGRGLGRRPSGVDAERTRTHDGAYGRIGFVFQQFNLVPYLTALENVALPLVVGRTPRRERDERARRALDAVGLSEHADQMPTRMSGGEQQRVAIARALVHEPAVVLADEPTGNLDSATGLAVMETIAKVRDQQGHAIVLVTHDERIASLADRIVRLRDGRVDHSNGS